MKIIALEEHWWTRELLDTLNAVIGDQHDDGLNLFSLASPDVEERMEDAAERRLADMRQMGVDMQVLSVGPPATQSLPAHDAITLARELNDQLSEAVRAHPRHFAGFATLPTADPEAAASELERAVTKLGLAGTLINGRTADRMLDAPEFDVIFQVASQLDVPIYIHPQIPPHPVRAAYYTGFDKTVDLVLATGGWGWHMEAGLTTLRIMLRGTLDRYPDLKLLLGHWGEMLPFWIERANRLSAVAQLERQIVDYLRDNVDVTPAGIFDQRLLQRSIDIVGVEHVMFSTDYPLHFEPGLASRRFIEDALLSSSDKHLIAHGNAERLLRIAAE